MPMEFYENSFFLIFPYNLSNFWSKKSWRIEICWSYSRQNIRLFFQLFTTDIYKDREGQKKREEGQVEKKRFPDR